jgi:hypothetical protein
MSCMVARLAMRQVEIWCVAGVCSMLVRNTELTPTKAFTDQEALASLQGQAPASSHAELAQRWGWNEAKVTRKLLSWTNDGRITRGPAPAEVASSSSEVVGGQPHSTVYRIGAYLTAISLASAAAYFSIGGLIELFPAQETAVAVLGGLLEVAKLVMVAWLTAHWHSVGYRLKVVMVLLVVGLVTVNAGGTFARLVESHFLISEAATIGVGGAPGGA